MDMISIVVPVYKVEAYIRQCLDSIVNQTYQNLEIIIIDDGSPDNCGEICDEYAAKDPRIKVVHKKNAGVGAARNDGISLAGGKWITFVDPDDWLDLNYYENVMAILKNDRPDIFFQGGAIWEYKNTKAVKTTVIKSFTYKKDRFVEPWEFLMAKTLDGSLWNEHFSKGVPLGYCWDKLYRAEFIRMNQLRFDICLHPDEDALFNFIAIDKAKVISGDPYVGYHYRQDNILSVTKRFLPNCEKNKLTYIHRLYEYQITTTLNPAIVNNKKEESVLRGIRWCIDRYYYHPDNNLTYEEKRIEIYKLKNDLLVQKVIWSKCNWNLPKALLLLKFFLRMPGVWPIMVFHRLNTMYHLKRSKQERT